MLGWKRFFRDQTYSSFQRKLKSFGVCFLENFGYRTTLGQCQWCRPITEKLFQDVLHPSKEAFLFILIFIYLYGILGIIYLKTFYFYYWHLIFYVFHVFIYIAICF